MHGVIGTRDEGYGLVETSASLRAAARRLPALDRRVLGLRFRDELQHREIADQIGASQMQMSRILRRAAEQLRDTAELV